MTALLSDVQELDLNFKNFLYKKFYGKPHEGSIIYVTLSSGSEQGT